MQTRRLFLTVLSVAALIAAACTDESAEDADGANAVDAPAETTDASAEGEEFDLESIPAWLPEHVEAIAIEDANTAPVIDRALADERIYEDYWLWDWWFVRDRDGEVADLDGWVVAIGLTAPADILPGKRHDVATHRYLISDDDGETWQEGGEVFGDSDPLGSRQWAGSAMYDDETGTLYAFYTAAGEDDEQVEVEPADVNGSPDNGDDDAEGQSADPGPSSAGDYAQTDGISYEQRMAVAEARVESDDDGVRFTDWGEHRELFAVDEDLYMSTADTTGGAGAIDAFRDPWFYRDGNSGEEYVLFTATLPEGRAECDADGVVGIAQRTGEDPDDFTEWEQLPPILTADCVNKELERPHIVERGDDLYLLFSTHAHTFDDELEGPEGLYGFIADDLFGDWEPLNGSALVLANPEEEPFQAYSWLMLPGGGVTGFFQYFDLDNEQTLDYVGTQDAEYQMDRFGGTFTPTVVVELDGSTTRVSDTLGPGRFGGSDAGAG